MRILKYSMRLLIIFVISVSLFGCGNGGNGSTPVTAGNSNVAVANTSPVASFTATPDLLRNNVDDLLKVSVDASLSTDAEDKDKVRVRWDWTNDGKWETDFTDVKIDTYKYPSAGTYTIKLEVIDRTGLRNTTTKQVSVSLAGKNIVNNESTDKADMVGVPAGTFAMGTAFSKWWTPATQQVTLSGFWIYKYEVTVAQYRAFCTATGRIMPTFPTGYSWTGKTTDWTDAALQQHPIVNVTWFDCKAYADWAGVSLPTEAQWEYAATGPKLLNYPWGGTATAIDPCNGWDVTKCANNTNSASKSISTWPVGSFQQGVSWCGAFDMAGNVWEWCADRYGSYVSTPVSNPTGSATGYDRMVRGGAWSNDGVVVSNATLTHANEVYYYYRGSYRYYYNPNKFVNDIGFRCVSNSPIK